MLETIKKYAIVRHQYVNQTYGIDQPYSAHLQMVEDAAKNFIHLIPEEHREDVLCACWTHDLIEDARESYNDVKRATNEIIADLTYALTNEKGRNRAERANDKYYEGIRNTPYATFIKLCDRIANMTYSIQTNSSMAKMYAKENTKFISKLYDPTYEEMINYLIKLTFKVA